MEIVQAKTFDPTGKELMSEVGEVGETMVPPPEIKLHDPVPIVGVLAAMFTLPVVIHID